MYLNEDESRPVRARPRRCLDAGRGGDPGRGCGGVPGRSSARQEVGWALRREPSFCGLLPISAPERPCRLEGGNRKILLPSRVAPPW